MTKEEEVRELVPLKSIGVNVDDMDFAKVLAKLTWYEETREFNVLVRDYFFRGRRSLLGRLNVFRSWKRAASLYDLEWRAGKVDIAMEDYLKHVNIWRALVILRVN